MDEKRKDRRIELISKLVIKRLDNGQSVTDEAIIDVLDVSKSGIGFKCATRLEIDGVYEAFLTIWTKEVIHAFIEIVRIVREEDYFIYGGIFIGMPDTDVTSIQVYQTVNHRD